MKKKGAALLVVIIIMMLTFLLAVIMFETSIKHLRVSNDSVDSTKAYYCAETGVYDAINRIKIMAETGSYSNTTISDLYLFEDPSATYAATIELIGTIENDVQNVTVNNKTITVSTPPREKIYNCKIDSKGNYNNENYSINDVVRISYNNNSDGWSYIFTSKLTTKE